jgi:hypothetical protein
VPPQSPDPHDDTEHAAAEAGDDEAFLAALEEEERDAAEVVCEALSGHRGAAPPAAELELAAERLWAGCRAGDEPYAWIARGAGLTGNRPGSDEELVLRGVAATIAPPKETGLDAEDEASIMATEPGDWAGALLELVRGGPGTAAGPADLITMIGTCPEVEGWVAEDEQAALAHVFALVTFPWERLGLLDDRRRLTALGAWTLPRGLTLAWGVDFDAPPAAGH